MTNEASAGRGWAAACHLAALIWLIGVPFGNLLGPLVVWLILRDRYPLVDDQGKEALNFQIAMAIAFVVLVAIGMLSFILAILIIPFFVGVLAMIALIGLVVFMIVTMVQAAMAVNKGEWYRYPIRMTFVK